MASTVRFSRVVEACGHPHVHTLWLAPEKDAELKRAREADRVMTVYRGRGKTDVGAIGFAPRDGTDEQYLIFPRSLRQFEGTRVVGVKFGLIAQPKLAAVPPGAWTAPPNAKTAKKKPVHAPVIPFERPALPHRESARNKEASEPRAVPPEPHRTKAKNRPPGAKPRAKRASAPPRQEKTPTLGNAALVREIRAALQELKTGKTVAAYQRLERAIDA